MLHPAFSPPGAAACQHPSFSPQPHPLFSPPPSLTHHMEQSHPPCESVSSVIRSHLDRARGLYHIPIRCILVHHQVL
ncbi:unnamed protein product [Coffea canephora]|uniref:Uncharacterized protein n=1 Tax=Coffea canephora TaxID=49390 RepID=A0A068UKC2_COFCA|nr:unnamed protein product [Coffea canephora]